MAASDDRTGVPQMLDSFSLDNDFSDDLDMDVMDLPLLAEQPGKRTTPKMPSISYYPHHLSAEKERKTETKKRSVSDDETFSKTKNDFEYIIENALEEKRIDQFKADRLYGSLSSGDWSEVAFNLLCENIP